MASKQPFKFIDIAQKLTTWSIRINKFFKHRLLSKRKNVLLITDSLKKHQSIFLLNQNKNELQKITLQQNQIQLKQPQFQDLLLKNFMKTWQITQLQSSTLKKQQITKRLGQNKNKNPEEQIVPENHFTPISISSFKNQQEVNNMQKYFSLKKKFYDAVIVIPQKQQSIQNQYPQIQEQSFATDFIEIYENQIMKNIVAYRFAHKFLTTSGTFIQSASQYDFLKIQKDKNKEESEKQKNVLSYTQKRPPASKQIIDSTICYLGIVIGDRDYTDINSWTLVSLSEQAALKNPEYVSKMYYDWADGQQLPMPGSFGLFKRKITQNKQLNFVQYL